MSTKTSKETKEIERLIQEAKDRQRQNPYPILAFGKLVDRDGNDIPDCLALGDVNGFVPTFDEFKEIVKKVARFYQAVGPDWVKSKNEELHNYWTTPPQPRRRNTFGGYNDKNNEEREFSEPGYVYIIRSPDNIYKIGKSKNVRQRLGTYRQSLPVTFKVVHIIKSSGYSRLETALHEKFSDCRVQGEWFRLTNNDVNWIKEKYPLTNLRAK